MQASILILNWNGLDVLRPCLAAIETNTAGCDYEVIVLDNGSEEQGVEDAVQPYSRVRLIKEPVNHGFSRGNNLAAAQARGEFLVILNNDTVPHAGWLPPLLAALKDDVGMAGARLVDGQGRTQFAGAYFDPAINAYARLYRNYPASSVTQPRECEAYIACGIALSRELFLSVGGFDEAYFQGYEDMDLCLKVRARGLRIAYVPDSEIEHIENVSMNRMRRRHRRSTKERNRAHFEATWKTRLHAFRLPLPTEGRRDFALFEKLDEALLAAVPPEPGRVLHLGCGTGRLGETLKKRWPASSVTGVEDDRTAVVQARTRIDEAIFAPRPESLPRKGDSYDTLILSGMLERSPDPWGLLFACAEELREGGVLITHVPNITHYKLLKRLCLRDWRYEPDGPLGQETLRFFSAGSLPDLLEGAGFGNITLHRQQDPGLAWRLASAAWPRAEELRTRAFVVTARRLGRARTP